MSAAHQIDLSFDTLKSKQRKLRDEFPSSLSLRVHRALSWLHRAEAAGEDYDAAFIFHWISFNAAYADELTAEVFEGERSVFEGFFEKLTSLDKEQRVYEAIWQKYPQAIRLLLENKYVFLPFWKHHNTASGYEDWELRFNRSKRRVGIALANRETNTILSILFDRLYVLRNQIVHGGATWNSAVNRNQVKDGARIMALLNPLFIDIMMDNANDSWGKPFYPVVD